MLKQSIGKIVLILAAMFTAGSVIAATGKAAAVQYSGSLLQSADAEKLFYCETVYDYIEEINHT